MFKTPVVFGQVKWFATWVIPHKGLGSPRDKWVLSQVANNLRTWRIEHPRTHLLSDFVTHSEAFCKPFEQPLELRGATLPSEPLASLRPKMGVAQK